MSYTWRPMTVADLPQVMAIAATVHAGYFEAEAVFAERLALFAQGCWIAHAQDGDTPVTGGYLFMHPARLGHPPALNTLLHDVTAAECLHLHDIALLPATRAAGLGRAAVVILREVMANCSLKCATLVAVHDSSRYWSRFGFVRMSDLPAACLATLATYGADAHYMCMR